MTTTQQHINTRNDQELLVRLTAKAEMMGIEDAAQWAYANLGKLITAPIDGLSTITDVHAYADEVRKAYIAATPPTPGSNPAAVTDTQLQLAITAVQNAVEL